MNSLAHMLIESKNAREQDLPEVAMYVGPAVYPKNRFDRTIALAFHLISPRTGQA